jgi:uncharacterized protein YjdB
MQRTAPSRLRPAPARAFLPASPASLASVAAPAVLAVLSVLAVFFSACGGKATTIVAKPGKVVLYGAKKSAVVTAEVGDAKGRPVEGATVTWEVSSTRVATVDRNGKLTSVAAGKAMLTARFGELETKVPVEVVDVAALALAPTRMTLAGPKGTSGRFTVTVTDSAGRPVNVPVKWSVSDPRVATIEAAGGSGVVSSVAEGRAGISAVLGDVSATADLTIVFREVGSFEVAPATVPLKTGDSSRLTVTARDAAGAAIEDVAVDWSSADPRTATVTAGVVQGVAAGSTTVTARCGRFQAEVSVLVF